MGAVSSRDFQPTEYLHSHVKLTSKSARKEGHRPEFGKCFTSVLRKVDSNTINSVANKYSQLPKPSCSLAPWQCTLYSAIARGRRAAAGASGYTHYVNKHM